MTARKARRHPIFIGSLAIVGLALAWHRLGYPDSFDEARFLHRLSVAKADDARTLDLAALMPGDWEMVCESHGYDGPRYIERYGRSYEPVGAAQDSAWGLIFIAADGSVTGAAGSCRVPGLLPLGGCLERAQAVLVRAEGGRTDCPAFVAGKRG